MWTTIFSGLMKTYWSLYLSDDVCQGNSACQEIVRKRRYIVCFLWWISDGLLSMINQYICAVIVMWWCEFCVFLCSVVIWCEGCIIYLYNYNVVWRICTLCNVCVCELSAGGWCVCVCVCVLGRLNVCVIKIKLNVCVCVCALGWVRVSVL